MFSRRTFLKGVGVTAGYSYVGGALPRQDQPMLRVIAYNVLKCVGWPSDRELARKAVATGQMPKRMTLELGLYDPDVISFSESPREQITLQIAELLGMNHVRFPSGGNWPGTILSRFPIVESTNTPLANGTRPERLFTRHWGRAVLQPPDGDVLIVHTAHLMPGQAVDVRLREIGLMVESMADDLSANRSMLLIGDLNHQPDTEEHKRWTDAGWVDTFAKLSDGDGFTIPASIPRSRIDYIFAAGPLAGRVQVSRPLHEGAFRVDAGDGRSFALSDHIPQFASFDLGN